MNPIVVAMLSAVNLRRYRQARAGKGAHHAQNRGLENSPQQSAATIATAPSTLTPAPPPSLASPPPVKGPNSFCGWARSLANEEIDLINVGSIPLSQ